jgi:NAD/NADP transhydrogenase alpha subunit
MDDDDTVQELRPGMRVIARLSDAEFTAVLAEINAAKRAAGHKPRRQRRRNLTDKLIAKAKAAGATSVVVEGVEMRFGPGGITAAASPDPWQADLERWKQ